MCNYCNVNKQLDEKCKMYQDEVNRLSNENKELSNKLSIETKALKLKILDLKDQNKKYVEKNSTLEEFSKKYQQLENDHRKLESVVTDKENEITRLLERLDTLNSEMVLTYKENEALKEENTLLQEQITKQEHNHIEEIELMREEFENRLENLESDKRDRFLQLSNNKLISAKTVISTKGLTLFDLGRESDLRDSPKFRRFSIDDLSVNSSDIVDEVELMDFNKLKMDFTNLQSENTKLKENYDQQIDKLNTQIEFLNNRVYTLSEENIKYKSMYENEKFEKEAKEVDHKIRLRTLLKLLKSKKHDLALLNLSQIN